MGRRSAGVSYFEWLYRKVGAPRSSGPRPGFHALLEQLHSTIFVAIVSHDENRIADAADLRYEYDVEQGFERVSGPCSMLELLVILSTALSFETDEPMEIWFWHLLRNLEIAKYADLGYDSHVSNTVASILERVIWRKYAPDGTGGLFPLDRPDRDQRNVELWYQLNAYLLEHF